MRKQLTGSPGSGINQQICRVRPLPFSATAFMAWEMRRVLKRTVVVITDNPKTQDEMNRNLTAFAGKLQNFLLYYPAWDIQPQSSITPDATGRKSVPNLDIVGDRMNTLNQLRALKEPVVVVTSVQALMQLTLDSDTLQNNTFHISIHDEINPENLIQRIEQAGYEFVPKVQSKGEAAWRGCLLDVWSPPDQYPCRFEFLGNCVDTIRSFDPADQRSFTRLNKSTITPVDEWRLMRADNHKLSAFMTHLPKNILFFWTEACADNHNAETVGHPRPAKHDFTELSGEPDPDLTIPFRTVLETIAADTMASQWFTGWNSIPLPTRSEDSLADDRVIDLGFQHVSELSSLRRDLFEPDLFEQQRREWLCRLEKRAKKGMCVHLFFNTQGSLDRFREMYPDTLFQLHTGMMSDGFIHESMQLAVITEIHITGYQKLLRGRYDPHVKQRVTRPRPPGETITDWTNIEPDDLVVHLNHGIGRYLGLYEIEFNGKLQETLAVEYADKAKLYVPVSHAHLLSRYIGVGKGHVRLHKLGGKRWFREKTAAEHAVRDLASSLLELQASREALTGFAFPADISWQHEFETAFPYEETADQEQAIQEVKKNMEARRPMDRLICGDVGYGKTEVALRAAFKAVTGGKQVAVLVPTTILAQQHFEVFIDRMSAYPIRIELLCRFRTRSQQADVARELTSGTVDIVIGTHRLLQPDIHFKDLGLVIIDEEQRFGVVHKERLKQMRQLVDILTLTATPIPRTLYMSLTGARDISIIQTSPKNRFPIETIVTRNEDRVVRDAVLRELNRDGQIYYVHNRVKTIEKIRERLQRLVPEARIAVGHGQMHTNELAQVMREFARGQFDLLLCTTIIESGVDIPNVNTILIDRADRFGMADLYQLRGRVGRSSRKAYAYLLLPLHGYLLDTPRKRINAIVQHSELGSGFRLAIRDLEIRGGGNLLGAEQSGHISAIGFDLYCQLLRLTVARTSKRKTIADSIPAWFNIVDVDIKLDFIDLSTNADEPERCAFLPASYVEDEPLRISIFRKIASAVSMKEIRNLRDEFQDRFGPIPCPLERLLKISAMRISASAKHVTAIETKNGKIMFKRHGDYIQSNHRFPRLRSKHTDEQLDEIIQWLKRVTSTGLS